MSTKTKVLIAVGGLAVIGTVWYLHSTATAATPTALLPAASQANPQLVYLQNWAASANDTAHPAMVNALPAGAIPQFYSIVHDYFSNNVPVPAALQAVWETYATPFGLG